MQHRIRALGLRMRRPAIVDTHFACGDVSRAEVVAGILLELPPQQVRKPWHWPFAQADWLLRPARNPSLLPPKAASGGR